MIFEFFIRIYSPYVVLRNFIPTDSILFRRKITAKHYNNHKGLLVDSPHTSSSEMYRVTRTPPPTLYTDATCSLASEYTHNHRT